MIVYSNVLEKLKVFLVVESIFSSFTIFALSPANFPRLTFIILHKPITFLTVEMDMMSKTSLDNPTSIILGKAWLPYYY